LQQTIAYFDKMKTLNLLFLLCMMIGFTGCIGEDGDKEQPGANIGMGDNLPEFTVKMNDGSTLKSSDLQGKVSVIMLFSVTCNHCKRQFVETEKVYAKYKDNPDVVMFGVSREQGEKLVSGYWNNPEYIDDIMHMPYSAQDDRYIYSLFAKSIIPRIYISDKNRVVQVVTTDKQPLPTAEQLEAFIEPLLK
jgi:Protein-disulfide isomerase